MICRSCAFDAIQVQARDNRLRGRNVDNNLN